MKISKKIGFTIKFTTKKDPCCFMSPYADMMYSTVHKINNINFKVILTDLDIHEIDNKFLFKDLK